MYKITITSENDISLDIGLAGHFSVYDCTNTVLALSNLFSSKLGISIEEFNYLLHELSSNSVNLLVNMSDINKEGENEDVQ